MSVLIDWLKNCQSNPILHNSVLLQILLLGFGVQDENVSSDLGKLQKKTYEKRQIMFDIQVVVQLF